MRIHSTLILAIFCLAGGALAQSTGTTEAGDFATSARTTGQSATASSKPGGFAEPIKSTIDRHKHDFDPPFIANVWVDTGWILAISFSSTEHTPPRVEICECAPIRVAEGQWKFPKSGGAIPADAQLQGDRYYAEFDVLLQSLHAGKPYNYIITVGSDDPTTSWPEQSIGRFTMASTGNPPFRCDSQEKQLIRGVDGSTADCFPYFCRGARCETTCNSVRECVAPTVCNSSGQCINPDYQVPASD